MRVNSVDKNQYSKSFQANPTGIAKNCKKAIRKMNIYGGGTIGVGTLGAITIFSTGCLLAGFACLIPTFILAKHYDKEVQNYNKLAKQYHEIKNRAKKIYA